MTSSGQIYSLSEACNHKFESILEIPQLSSSAVIEVLHQRFVQWASYLGALARDSVSLDSRLTHSDSLRSLVLQFLEITERNLAYVESLEHQHPKSVAHAQPNSVIDDVSQKDVIQSPLVETLQVLEAAVDGLHRLGVAIRRSSFTGLDQRVESFIERKDDGTIQKLFFFRLKLQLIDRAKNDNRQGAPLSLCKQLASSISSRYFRVLYRRSHQKKLETRRQPSPLTTNIIETSKQGPNAPSQNPGPAPKRRDLVSAVMQRHMDTKRLPDEISESAPTIPHPKRALEIYASSGKVASTVGGTSQVSVRLNNVNYPDLPKPSSTSNTAVCPYCTQFVKGPLLSTKTLWERHVDKDLQLYACISEDCLEPPRLFCRLDEWHNHMTAAHSIHWPEQIHKPIGWCCDTDHEEIYFYDEYLFNLHIKDEHPEYETASDVAQFREWCETQLPRPPYTCPICNCVPEDVAEAAPWLAQSPSIEPFTKSTEGVDSPSITESLENSLRHKLATHVATHLKQLGFMSLIYLDGDEGESDLSRQASKGAEEEKRDFPGFSDALDPDFSNYVAPKAPDPLEEGLFDLDWTSVKDLSQPRQTLPWRYAYEAVRESDPQLIERYDDRLATDLHQYAAGSIYSSLFTPPQGRSQGHANPVYDIDYASFMEKLGTHLRDSYLAKGSLDDLEASLFFMARSLNHTPDSHPSWPYRCNNVGLGLRSRYLQSASMDDLKGALEASRKALAATPESHPNRPEYLNNLARNLEYEYTITGSQEILFEAIQLAREALIHSPEDHSSRPDFLTTLANQLSKRYLHSGDIVDLEEAIQLAREALIHSPEDHSSRPDFLTTLANQLSKRYLHSGNIVDLEEAIRVAEIALDATDGHGPQTLVIRGNLGEFLRLKYLRLGDVGCLNQAVSMAREVAAQSSATMDDTDRPEHLMNLAIGLKDRHSATGNRADLEEAIAIVKEALTLYQTDESHPDRAGRLNALGSLMSLRYSATGDLVDLNQAIDLVRQAVEMYGGDHPCELANSMDSLASSLRKRYTQTVALEDLEEAVRAARNAVLFTPSASADMASYTNNLALCLEKLYQRTGEKRCLDEAIQISEHALHLIPEDHATEAPPILSTAGLVLASRFSAKNHPARGVLDDIEKAMQHVEEAAHVSPEWHTDQGTFLANIGHVAGIKYMHCRQPEDLTKAIEALRQAVTYSHESHPDRAASLINLGRLLRETGKNADMEEALDFFTLVLNATQSPNNLRISAGRLCLASMDVAKHSEEAYEIARTIVSLIPISAPASMRLADREHILYQTVGLASDAAAIALYAHKERPVEALRLLETGRDIIARSLQNMRIDLSDLRASFPELASSFEEVRGLLDRSSFPGSGGSLLEQREFESVAAEVDARHKASARMDAVLSEIHRQPGFEHFLDTATEAQMCNAATPGPMVVVNFSRYGCAAIIIEKSGIQVLDLEKLTYEAVEEMTPSQQSPQCLEWLWEIIVGPVLDFLGFHKTPSAGESWPHVWWIPTGPLEGFPLHAAGKHFGEKGTTALDRVVSSYSPSVQSLIDARKQRVSLNLEETGKVKIGTDVSGGLNLQRQSKRHANAVLVSMSETPNLSRNSIADEETDAVRQACEIMRLPCFYPDRYQKDVLAALYDSCKVFHFVGHSRLSDTDPMGHGLLLQDWKYNPLTAKDLLGMNLVANSPFLAFLSAYGTSQILDRRAVDENIHLARMFQLAGFRHVIGTQGQVRDNSCVETVKMTYQALCDGGMTDVSVSEGLHHAIRRLRDDWVRSLDKQRHSDSLKPAEARAIEDINKVTPKGPVLFVERDELRPLWASYVHFGP